MDKEQRRGFLSNMIARGELIEVCSRAASVDELYRCVMCSVHSTSCFCLSNFLALRKSSSWCFYFLGDY